MRFLVALGAALLSVVAQAQSFPHAGVFPGRLPADIVSPPSPPPGGLQAPWQQAVVGSGAGGNAVSSSNVLTDSCQGIVDYFADSGNFVYQSLSGDQEMIGRLDTIVADEVWSRYVPVVRQSTAAGSKYAGLFFDHRTAPGGFVAFNWRLALDGHNDYVGFDTAWTSPQWWRITRAGSNFSGYLGPSSAGPWTLNGSQSVTMSDPIDWGVLCENGAGLNPAVETSLLPTISAPGGGSAGTVQFTTGDEPINENASALTVSVSRAGGSTGAGSVVVSGAGTSNATLTTDYTVSCTLPCTLSWSGGDAANKTFTVTPVNRAGSQASRHLDLALGSASGVTLGLPATKVITINDVSGGATTKWNPGVYGDCFSESSSAELVAIGSPAYTQLKSCMDYWAAQLPTVKGVFFEMAWSSFEGDTIGCYDATCSNQLSQHVTGRIGFPLLDDLLAYAASKGLKAMVGISWYHFGGYGGCGVSYGGIDDWTPKYLRATTECSGTDASNTYGVIRTSSYNAIVTSLWKTATMDRYIALINAYGDRYDSNSALEEVLLMTEEGDIGDDPALAAAGYSFTALSSQETRLPAATKSHWAHTNMTINMEWIDPSSNGVSILLAGYNTPSQAIGYYQNDHVPWITTSGGALWAGYRGACASSAAPCWGNPSTHDFRGQLPMTLKVSDELCGGAAAGGAYPYSSPQRFYDAAYTTGLDDTGVATKPTHYLFARSTGINYCPGSANQQWGNLTSGGLMQFLQTHPMPPSGPATCPTAYTGCAP